MFPGLSPEVRPGGMAVHVRQEWLLLMRSPVAKMCQGSALAHLPMKHELVGAGLAAKPSFSIRVTNVRRVATALGGIAAPGTGPRPGAAGSAVVTEDSRISSRPQIRPASIEPA